MTLVLCVILCGLAFEYINGFHHTANAIATVVSTRVLSPRQAVFMAACCNLIGPLWGTAVATTIGKGLVDTGSSSPAPSPRCCRPSPGTCSPGGWACPPVRAMH